MNCQQLKLEASENLYLMLKKYSLLKTCLES